MMDLNASNCRKIVEDLKFMWIEHELGPQRMSVIRQILIGIVYTAIFCTGLLGNLATCIVIVRTSFMHTRTNCYLFTLAVSDLLLLVFVVNEAYSIWKSWLDGFHLRNQLLFIKTIRTWRQTLKWLANKVAPRSCETISTCLQSDLILSRI
ncbi:unnamed protein product [Heterobilharzia americana]|nr:unnamed protein product [Heterobilharzia americana]